MGNVTERELLVRRPYEIMSLFNRRSRYIAEHVGAVRPPGARREVGSGRRPSPFAHLDVDCFACYRFDFGGGNKK